MKLELALWLPDHPRRPFVYVSEAGLTAILRAVGLTADQADKAARDMVAAIEYKARRS